MRVKIKTKSVYRKNANKHRIQQLRAALAWGVAAGLFTLESDVRLYVQVFGCSSIAVDVLPGVPDIKLRNSDEEV